MLNGIHKRVKTFPPPHLLKMAAMGEKAHRYSLKAPAHHIVIVIMTSEKTTMRTTTVFITTTTETTLQVLPTTTVIKGEIMKHPRGFRGP